MGDITGLAIFLFDCVVFEFACLRTFRYVALRKFKSRLVKQKNIVVLV